MAKTHQQDAARMLRAAARLIEKAEALPTLRGKCLKPGTYEHWIREAVVKINAALARLS